MSKTRSFLGLAVMLLAFVTTAAPSWAEFRDLRVEPKPEAGHCETTLAEPRLCGTNLTPLVLKVGTSTFECPKEAGVILLWRIETEKLQEVTVQGPHLLLAFHCEGGLAKIGGGAETKAKLEPTCRIQIRQPVLGGPITGAKVEENCVIVTAAKLCTVTVPPAGNEELKEITGENLEEKAKGLKYLLLNPKIKGITAKAAGTCGFKESKVGELTEGKTDIWDVSLV